MSIAGGCGNINCGGSTGIHGDDSNGMSGLTFGSGELDFNGYWEHPCDACARAFEKIFPEAVPCWPFSINNEAGNG